MDVYQEYKGKCCTADQAVQVVKDGDWVDYGMSCAYPTALDKALARRQGDLKDIKVRNAISCHPVAILEADPENETFTYNLWHCSAIDRKYLDAGRAYHEPMLFRDCGSYYTRGFAPVNVAMITVAPMDRHGNFSFGLTNGCTQEMLDAAGEHIAVKARMMDYVDALGEEFSEGMQGADDHDHDHDDHDHDHDTLEDGHEEDIEYDEHIWTSPVNAMALCRAICDTLCQADPAHEENYRARLEAYLTELEALDATFRDIVEHGSRRLLVFGDRFPLLYFCLEYGLDYRAAFHGCAGDTEPSLATMKYLIDLVRARDIPVVYTIELSSQKIAQAVAETTGASVRTFHSCQTVSRAELERGETYISLMTANAGALREGLS